jgi:hypothetical protein
MRRVAAGEDTDMKPRLDFTEALESQGYTVLFAIGFKESGEDYRLKIAATPSVKTVSPETYKIILETLMDGLTRLYDTPMDDLEFMQ